MTVQDIPHVAEYLLKKHGLADKGWNFAWDNARRRAGCCSYSTKTIRLSRHYVELNVAERLDDVIDTILHEIAHALTPGKHHGPEWRAACEQVGARPERCYDAKVVSMPKGRFVAACPGCGKKFYRHRIMKPGRWRYCLACGPDRGRLEYRDSTTTPVPDGLAAPLTPKKLRQ